MPRSRPSRAIKLPIAPSPRTPRVLPCSSAPANCFLLASSSGAISSAPRCGSRDEIKFIPPTISRDAKSMPAATSSFTALALAPGVLNTTMPLLVQWSRGILLTPAPALAMALTDSGISPALSLWLRSNIASGPARSLPTSKQSGLSRSSPLIEIALYVRT